MNAAERTRITAAIVASVERAGGTATATDEPGPRGTVTAVRATLPGVSVQIDVGASEPAILAHWHSAAAPLAAHALWSVNQVHRRKATSGNTADTFPEEFGALADAVAEGEAFDLPAGVEVIEVGMGAFFQWQERNTAGDVTAESGPQNLHTRGEAVLHYLTTRA